MKPLYRHSCFLFCAFLFGAGMQAMPVQVAFYGNDAGFDVPASWLRAPVLPESADHLKFDARLEQWGLAAGLPARLEQLKSDWQLDDYAAALVLRSLALQCQGNTQDAVLMSWFLLRQAGYDAILGFASGQPRVYLRLAFMTEGTLFVPWMGKRYTLFHTISGPWRGSERIFLSPKEPQTLAQAVFMRPGSAPRLGTAQAWRSIRFVHGNREYALSLPYRKHWVAYLDDLPVISLGPLFVQSALSPEARRMASDSLRRWAGGMTRMQQLHLLLSFVQQGFSYRRDRDYLPFDKHNFPEQTLAAAYADCEDKAVLFLSLARDAFRIKGQLLYNESQEHIAAAVELPPQSPGASFSQQGIPYLICEPAFNGFKPGETRLPLREPGKLLL